MGSNPKMEKLNDKSSYELYGSSDISLGRLFWYRRFDTGMVAFLQCLSELGDYAESQDRTFKLPYKYEQKKKENRKEISKYKIMSKNIKVGLIS